MLRELEFNVNPEFTDLLERLLHFSLLYGLVSHFFDVLSDSSEIEVPNVFKLKVGVKDELHVHLVSNCLPMAFTHGRVSEGTNKQNELKPLLKLLEDSNISVAPLVYFHALQLLLKLLDNFIHLFRVGGLPSVDLEATECLLALVCMVPEALHKVHFVLDLTNLNLRWFNEIGVLELDCVVFKVLSLSNELINLSVNVLEGNKSLFTASLILVEVSLLHQIVEVLKCSLMVVDSEFIGLALIVYFLGDLFLHFLGEFLKTSPFVEELLGLLRFFLLIDAVASEELQRLIKLVKNESSFIVLQEDGLHAILNADKDLDIVDVLILDGSTSLSLLHELLQLFNLLLGVLDE